MREAQAAAFAAAQDLTRIRNEITALDLQKQGNVVRLEKLSAEKIQLEEERTRLEARLQEFTASVEVEKLNARTTRVRHGPAPSPHVSSSIRGGCSGRPDRRMRAFSASNTIINAMTTNASTGPACSQRAADTGSSIVESESCPVCRAQDAGSPVAFRHSLV